MPDFRKIATLADLEDTGRKVVNVDGRPIALFQLEDKIFAIENTCRHRGGPLAEGPLEDTVVKCPWHSWAFNLKDGKSPNIPDVEVEVFRVKVEGENILIAI